MMPAVSVLMPVYNAQDFLAAAMESILQQSFRDFEFLIIDDGSTDDSVAIIQSYQDPRIRLCQNEQNLGISATLNKGIDLARAPYIARMDADDVAYPDRLQKQVTYLKQNPACAMVSSFVKVIDEQGKFVRQDDFKSEYFYYNLTFICWIYHPTVMYRREAVQAVNGYTKPYAEDFELFWQLSRNYRIHTLPELLLDYRVTSKSLHQVLRKEEYAQAQQEQIQRNIQYYTRTDKSLPPAFIDCYQYSFLPLLQEKKVHQIVACLKTLDGITQKILETENPNRNSQDIQKAAIYKKRYIVNFFLKRLAWPQRIYLLLSVFTLKDVVKFYRAQAIEAKRKKATPALQKQPHLSHELSFT
ncbi:glycosyltransferase [Rufibacter sp. DG15C]|uniref:glycosyltransferase family 2 protein n=1 Tax=Rufibacter sp. DG15C TaxID=1379909 RepID=UPI00082B4B5E|nr:glycosyltransferase [Rufibacter sp. DG15C]